MNIYCRLLGLVVLLCSGKLEARDAMTVQPDFRLWADVSAEQHLWTVTPRIAAPAGRQLRYEINAVKSGKSGRSQTRQSGQVLSSAESSVVLASLSLGIVPGDDCDIDIRLFDGANLVGEMKLHLPPD